MKNLLIEFADVFSVHEFDLGNFTAIEHAIDTGDAAPVKQKFRRNAAVIILRYTTLRHNGL